MNAIEKLKQVKQELIKRRIAFKAVTYKSEKEFCGTFEHEGFQIRNEDNYLICSIVPFGYNETEISIRRNGYCEISKASYRCDSCDDVFRVLKEEFSITEGFCTRDTNWVCKNCGFHNIGTSVGNDMQYCWRCGENALCKYDGFSLSDIPLLDGLKSETDNDAAVTLRIAHFEKTGFNVFRKGNEIVQKNDDDKWEHYILK